MTGGGSGDWIMVDDNGKRANEVTAGPASTQYAYDEAYFLTDPYQFIYSHIPGKNNVILVGNGILAFRALYISQMITRLDAMGIRPDYRCMLEVGIDFNGYSPSTLL